MRRITYPLLLFVLWVTTDATAQTEDRRNAATWYQRAIDEYGRISESDRDLISEYARDPQGPPSAEVQEVLRRSGGVLNHFRRGSEQEYSDFNLDWSEGFEMLLPHLGELRGISRLAMADAMNRLHQGDTRGAAERLGTIYRASSHVGDDRILISSLVGQAIFAGADGVVQRGLDQAAFGAGESAMLLRAMQPLENDDPFDYLEAVIGEQTIAVEWLDKKFGEQTERIRLAEEMEWITSTPEEARTLASMTDEEFELNLANYDLAMDRAVEVFAIEDVEVGKAMLKELEDDISAGDYGFLPGAVMPAMLRVYENKIKAMEQIAARREQLKQLMTGEIEPQREANAALFYLRAAELMSKLKPEQEAPLRRFLDSPGNAADDELTTMLLGAHEVIDLIREGSQLKRCDFSSYRKRPLSALLSSYAAGLHNALRLLHADALRLFADGNVNDAVERLAISYRVIAHLSADDPLVVSLIVHEAFRRTERLVERGLLRECFNDIHILQLFDAIDLIPRGDPFGYIGSVIETRKEVVRELLDRSPALNHQEDFTRLKEAAQAWDGDHLMYLMAIFDTLKNAAKQADAASTRELTTLDDMLAPVLLGRTRDELPIVAPIIAQGRLTFFEQRSIPKYAAYLRRARTARGDLRSGVSRLRPGSAKAGRQKE